jgi:prepilin-type N-terminal cleavage/methylation domain-containing protein/prepilin-type processing-associated H-X9-DG protein
MHTTHSRRAFTLVELLTVIAIIGLLVALLLPAVQGARESGRRTSCMNKIRNVALACEQYHAQNGAFAPGGVLRLAATLTDAERCLMTATSATAGGPPWTVCILPFLEGKSRYDSYDLNGSFARSFGETSATNRPMQFTFNTSFVCPSDPNTASGPHGGTNYFACQGGGPAGLAACAAGGRLIFHNGAFHANSRITAGHIRDGLSNVILIGETRYAPVISRDPAPPGIGWDSALRWYADGLASMAMGLCATNNGINSEPRDPTTLWYDNHIVGTFSSRHPGGASFSMADGSTHFFSESIDLDLYRRLGQRNSRTAKSGFQ